MMSNFLFSVNVTIPIFLVMALGYLLKRTGMLDDHFAAAANKFNFHVTLPVMLFRDITSVDIRGAFDLRYVIFCALSSTVCFWLIWGGSKLLIRNKEIRGAFVQASFRSSAAVMGLAFIENIYGASAMGPLMIIGAVPLYNIFSVIVLTFESADTRPAGRTEKVKEAVAGIFKNPIILAIFAGLFAAFFGLRFPAAVNKTIGSVAQMATPLALITIGVGFRGRDALAKLKPTAAAALLKLVVQPLLFVPIAVWMGFTGEKLVAILIMLAAPTTPSCYIMAKNMKNDEKLTASVVVATTLLAAFTLTGWIFLLKSCGYL